MDHSSTRRGPGPEGGKGRTHEMATPPPPSDELSLNVAQYQWVPQPGWFVAAIEAAWQEVHPDVVLNWVQYDCYHDDPPPTLDVFAFDTIFASYFISRRYLSALPVMDLDDFYTWSLFGVSVNSEWLWAIPYLGCLNTLIYRDGDPDLGEPGLTNDGLLSILGVSPNTAPEPDPDQGLLVDLTGGTTDACLYLQTVMENDDSFPLNPALPTWSNLDPLALKDLRQLVQMAGLKQATFVDPGSERLDWFMGGSGRCLVGLTETLGFLNNAQVGSVQFRPLPVASAPVGTIPLFADAWAVNSAVTDPTKNGIAKDFITIASRPEVMLAALTPASGQTPQYLTPVRDSVLTKLASAFEVYDQILSLVGGPATAAFRLGLTSRAWLSGNAAGIRNQILGTTADLDQPFAALRRSPTYASTPAGIWRKA